MGESKFYWLHKSGMVEVAEDEKNIEYPSLTYFAFSNGGPKNDITEAPRGRFLGKGNRRKQA